MKEKYTITITEKGTSIDIEHGSAIDILARISVLMKQIVEAAPTSICKDKNDRKKPDLGLLFCSLEPDLRRRGEIHE